VLVSLTVASRARLRRSQRLSASKSGSFKAIGVNDLTLVCAEFSTSGCFPFSSEKAEDACRLKVRIVGAPIGEIGYRS
jgi:hypothetical protein